MKTTNVSAAVLAALLLATPPAGASAHKPKKAKINPEVQRLMSAGLGELQRGEYTAAIGDLNKAVRTEGTVSTYFLLGWAHYQRGFKQGSVETADRDDAQSAIDAYGMALNKDPELTGLPDASRLYFSLALCEEAVGSYDRALEAYKSALRLAPNKALIPLHAARLRLKMKDEAKAMSNLSMAVDKANKAGQGNALIAAVQKDPSFAPILADKAMRRMLGVSAPAASENLVASNADFRGEEMRDAVRDTPRAAPAQDPAVLDKISAGDAEFKYHRYQNAIASYGEALNLDAERGTLTKAQTASLFEKIGTADNKVGRSEAAVASLRRALQIDPMSAAAHYQIALAYAVSGRTAESLRALKDCFSSASNPSELRRYVIMAKTDSELEAVRDLPGFRQILGDVADRVALR